MINRMARRRYITSGLLSHKEYTVYEIYLIIIIMCLWPGLIQTGKIDRQCDRCQVKGGINCTVTELPYPCFLPESDEKDFPHQPRDVESDKHLYNESRWHLHLSWKLPYDYSYSVVTGFEMVIDSIIPMAHVKVQPMRCFHINLNGVDWSEIDDVHNLEFKLDCLEYDRSEYTRNLVVTLYSLPKAAKNSDYTSHRLVLPGIPLKNMWSPTIHVSPNSTGLKVNISPPFKMAAYHLICVENSRSICIDGKIRVNKTDDRQIERFIEVPGNQSYKVMVRPCNAAGRSLDDWVSDHKHYFVNSTIPGTSSPPVNKRLDDMSYQPGIKEADNTVYIITLVVVAILLFLTMIFLVIFFRKSKCPTKHFKFLRKICREQKHEEAGLATTNRDRHSVIITPILLQQPEMEKLMAEAHLKLLEKQDGISIIPTPFLSNNKSKAVQEISTWVDEQINLAIQNNNHYFIIYTSDDMKVTLTEPDMFHANHTDQICVQFIKRLLDQNIEKRVLVVCFGNVENYDCVPFTKFHRMFSAVRLVDGSRCQAVSFSGSVDLLKHLLDPQTDYSFNSDETNLLRSIFLRSQHLMARSLDALTTKCESDSESAPFIQDNRTFVGPDSIAGSQSDVNAEMNGVNRRAGWPDVC